MSAFKSARRWIAEWIAGDAIELPPATRVRPGSECDHLWSDWSAAAAVDPFTVASEWGDYARITYQQERHCFTCKLVQRSLS